jgi:hypothetical protein
VKVDDKSDARAPEHADFAAARVGGSRRRTPLTALGWLVVLGGVVAVGLSGRTGDAGADGGGVTTPPAAGHAAATRLPSSSIRIVEGTRSPRFDPDFPTLPPRSVEATSEPGPINLDATRQSSSVFVHGDVFAENVTWVYVSLQTPDGRVAGWASVSIPGAAGDGRDQRPALRFDVELAIPTAMASGALSVQANAYDVSGTVIASTRVRLDPQM